MDPSTIYALITFVFLFGYVAITMEHTLKIDKLIPAVLMMGIIWAIISMAGMPVFEIHEGGLREAPLKDILLHHFGKVGEILFFLIGAMIIVEIIDFFNGFGSIKKFITTKNKRYLLWIIVVLAFFLSAIIDNLTATIVLITILKKLIPDQKLRMRYAGMIIIAANAGGAWSPIGDVTTTMLWIANKVTAWELTKNLLLPSLLCAMIPTLFASFLPVFKGNIPIQEGEESGQEKKPSLSMLLIGLGAIMFVPVFKTITHLPPWAGMMIAVGFVGAIAEKRSNREFSMGAAMNHKSSLHTSMTKIELPSILFFLGILMAVAGLESLGMIFKAGEHVQKLIPNEVFILLLGFGSAIIDNVPLVAAAMGMFQFPTDDPSWHLTAFSAGTGGSMLIIGSAAGVVAMGMEKIPFMWYLKNIAWLALIGFLAGSAVIVL
jgi:Na+/H+ antiporter NhaD/arsenite permease-like protein